MLETDSGNKFVVVACSIKGIYGKQSYDIEVKHNLVGLYASTIARRIAKVDCLARNMLLKSDGAVLLSIEGIKVSPVPNTAHIVLSIIDDREDSISLGSYTTKWIDGDDEDTDDTGSLYQHIVVEKV
jgi:hypothetical protein